MSVVSTAVRMLCRQFRKVAKFTKPAPAHREDLPYQRQGRSRFMVVFAVPSFASRFTKDVLRDAI